MNDVISQVSNDFITSVTDPRKISVGSQSCTASYAGMFSFTTGEEGGGGESKLNLCEVCRLGTVNGYCTPYGFPIHCLLVTLEYTEPYTRNCKPLIVILLRSVLSIFFLQFVRRVINHVWCNNSSANLSSERKGACC